MKPVVGYQGGKRRLLPRLRPYFLPDTMSRYVEPFVGMGALYLDVRGRGFRGPAIIADSHPQVASFWRLLHDQPGRLIQAAERIGFEPATAERYFAMLGERVDDDAELVARFLWLTNYAYGNAPNVYRSGWSHTTGTKLTSAAKWGKTFPWPDCVDRLREAARIVEHTETLVLDDAADALARTLEDDCVYADPPYQGQRRYSGSSKKPSYLSAIEEARGQIVLSESPAVAGSLSGWLRQDGAVTARMSGGVGATGVRGECVYVRSRVPRINMAAFA